eukprot:Gb_01551 [translate_table: standard]
MPADPEGDTPNFRNSGQLNAPSRPGPVIHGLNLRDGATSQGVLADTLKHHFLSDSARRCNPKSPKSPKSAAVSVNASARKVSPSLSRPVPKLVSRTDDAHPKDVQVQEQQLPEVVYTPRMPGDEAPQGLDSRTGTDAVQETLEKEGLLVRVPDFLTKLTGASRNGMRACPKLKPLSLGDRRNEVGPFSHRAHRAKSAAPSIVTVPVSAKQWLLQAIGLQDSEIKDLFKQIQWTPTRKLFTKQIIAVKCFNHLLLGTLFRDLPIEGNLLSLCLTLQ